MSEPWPSDWHLSGRRERGGEGRGLSKERVGGGRVENMNERDPRAFILLIIGTSGI